MTIGLLILWALTVVGFLIVLDRRDERAREERRDLENQLLALAQPIALTHMQGVRNPANGSVSYVTEKVEAEREKQ